MTISDPPAGARGLPTMAVARQITPPMKGSDRTQFDAFITLADHQQELGHFDTAVGLYGLALAMDPDCVPAAERRARALFCLERFPEAWRALRTVQTRGASPPALVRGQARAQAAALPVWSGGPLPKRLLIRCEPGLSDILQFVRFLPRLAALGVEPVLAAPEALFALLRTLKNAPRLVSSEQPAPIAGLDAAASLMDLPLALRLEAEGLACEPYLFAEPERVARWRRRIGGGGRLVGIRWRDSAAPNGDPVRSARLADFGPLAEVPGLRLLCLQEDATREELAAVPFADRIEVLGPDFETGPDALLDTAAVLTLCERLVSVDGALVHLAGALGRPADLLLQPNWADWRWFNRPQETVWYASLRLLRRAAHESWRDIVARAAADFGARPTSSAIAPLAPPAAPPVAPAIASTVAPPVASPVAPFGVPVSAFPRTAGDTPSPPAILMPAAEILDRIAALDILISESGGPGERAALMAEARDLRAAREALCAADGRLAVLAEELAQVHARLAALGRAMSQCESEGAFDGRFVQLARNANAARERREILKREIGRRSAMPRPAAVDQYGSPT